MNHKIIETELGNYFIINPKTGNWIISEDKLVHPKYLDENKIHKYLKDRVDMIILNTTERCNLECVYCSVGEKGYQDMNMDVGRKILERVVEFKDPRTRFIFHGSEPFLNKKFIKDFVINARNKSELIRQKYVFSIQSNATLLSMSAVNFLKSLGIEVSFSLDGMRKHQDLTREFKKGKSSYQAVLNGIENLRTYQNFIPPVTVVSSYNVNDLFKIAKKFKEDNYHRVQFTLLQPTGNASENLKLLPDIEILTKQMKKIFDWNLESILNGEKFRVRNLTNTLATFFYSTRPEFCSNCGVYRAQPISIDVNGDYYPCDFWWKEKEVCLGNVYTHSLKEALNNKKNFRFGKNSPKGIFWRLHNNGCPVEGFRNTGKFKNSEFYIPYFEKIYTHLAKKIPKLYKDNLIGKILSNR